MAFLLQIQKALGEERETEDAVGLGSLIARKPLPAEVRGHVPRFPTMELSTILFMGCSSGVDLRHFVRNRPRGDS